MSGKATAIVQGLVVLATAGATLALYPTLPDVIPMHWNASGQVDGWWPRATGAWFVPGLALLLAALTWVLPWLSPHQFRVDGFRTTYHTIMALMAVLFGGIHAVAFVQAYHPDWDLSRWLIGGLCIALGLLGNVLGKVRRNFWIGVRTPWTLASDVVWDATHRLAARLTFGAGLLGALLVVIGMPPAIAFVLVVAGLVLPAGWSLVYYKRFEAAGRL